MPSKERLAAVSSQLKAQDEEYSHDSKFNGGRLTEEPVPQRYRSPLRAITGASGRRDLEWERRQTSFNTRDMNYFIHGGKPIVEVNLIL